MLVPEYYYSTARVAVQAVPKGSNDSKIMAAVERVAEATTDFSWLSRGDAVMLKPASNSPKVYPSTTSHLAIRAMIALLKQKGARRIVVADKPGVEWVYHNKDRQKGSSRKCLMKNGLHTAAIESGAEMHYFDEAGYDAYFGARPVNANHWKRELALPSVLHDVDHIINLPRVSRHCLTGATLGIKSAVGWLRDDSRLELHRDGWTFYDKIAEINDAAIFRDKLRLTLTVATKVQTTFGPDWGYKTEPDPGLVFGSESLLAHDMIALGWLLWNQEQLTPSFYQNDLLDWYSFWPSAVNRWLVCYVWGMKEFIKSEAYSGVNISSARKDPILRRAAAIWGGFPKLELEELGEKLPSDVRKFLMEKAST
jgi:uncharacterized protein (DUF362 family)